MRVHQSISVDPKGRKFHYFFAAAALATTVLAIWALTHEYRGLALDGQIYAVQALARLRPSLNNDLFLQNTTQDRFTIFSFAYARVISWIGLNPAAMAFTALFSIWFLCAAWKLASDLFNRNSAWFVVFLVVITGGNYGASGVFRYLEPYLTARLPAEALVVTAFVLHFRRLENVALLLATLAMFVHPLVALPGLLFLISMRLSSRLTGACAGMGVLCCAVIAFAAARVSAINYFLPIMDSSWLEVVRERSQFLFLQLWTLRDWELTARPFVGLTLAWIALHDPNVRKLAACAMLIGATGLIIAGIASAGGPALLLQGQAWRWMWITTFVSLLLLVPTVRHLWNAGDTWGRVCAVLSVAGWSFSSDIGFVFSGIALSIWIFRGDRCLQSDWIKSCAITVVAIAVLVCMVVDTREAVASIPDLKGHSASVVSTIKAVLGLKIWCVVFAWSVWYWLGKSRSVAQQIFVVCALAALSVLLLYESFIHANSYGRVADINEFADWRRRIPVGSTVFVTHGYDSGSFVWFTLERNNYLSSGQSAGVVFSRATAMEVRRRSDVLLPLVDPIWKVLTSLRQHASGTSGTPSPNHRSLTPQALVTVCSDSALGFVISPENVGFDPLPHPGAGMYQNWNLYDCNHVRALFSES